jgi:hypothetical protein
MSFLTRFLIFRGGSRPTFIFFYSFFDFLYPPMGAGGASQFAKIRAALGVGLSLLILYRFKRPLPEEKSMISSGG